MLWERDITIDEEAGAPDRVRLWASAVVVEVAVAPVGVDVLYPVKE
jgi:hypothetical protein